MPASEFKERISSVSGKIIVDLGTGDGLHVYHSARSNPQNFYIGIDPNLRPLAKISEKIHRKVSKGGVPNAMYVQASAQGLPEEFHEIANAVEVLFPWGSLLRAMVVGDREILGSIRTICSSEAALRIVVSQDLEKDRSTIASLDLPALSLQYLQTTLTELYSQSGFRIIETAILSSGRLNELKTTWARRLRQNKQRTVYLVRAVAAE